MNRVKIINNKKQCRLCLKWKDVSEFGTFLDKKKNWVASKRYINSRCKECSCKTTQKWQKDKRPILYARWKEKKAEMLEQIRKAYGGKCSCCGESNPLFLTIDHINNDGYKLRPRNKNGNYSAKQFSGHYYAQIIKSGFPKDLQLLCWNCNCGRQRNGGTCPHKNKKL